MGLVAASFSASALRRGCGCVGASAQALGALHDWPDGRMSRKDAKLLTRRRYAFGRVRTSNLQRRFSAF